MAGIRRKAKAKTLAQNRRTVAGWSQGPPCPAAGRASSSASCCSKKLLLLLPPLPLLDEDDEGEDAAGSERQRGRISAA